MTEEESVAIKRKTAWISVFSNTLLVCLKLFVGIYVGAVSLISEAAHSAIDLLAALIALYAVRKSTQPPDKEHAYGHGKFENLSSAIEAILIIIAAVVIVYEAINKFSNLVEHEFLEYGIIIMIISIVVNYLVSRRLIKVAKMTSSQALEADGLHLQADLWTSAGVLVGLAAMKVTGWLWLDPVIAILVAVIIFKAGYKMTVESTNELTDMRLPVDDEKIIKDILTNHVAVVGFHRLRTRRSGAYRLLDVHIILDKNMPLLKVHEICDQLEGQIKEAMEMCDVVIHAEPVGHKPELRFICNISKHQ